MAVMSQIKCVRCKEMAEVLHSGPRPQLCGRCRRLEKALKREHDLSELAALPIEERLRRIEEWIYDYRPEYVPPPRF